jgi:ribonuclease HI
MRTVFVNIDGGCRDNPGPGAWGVVIREDGVETQEICGFLPICTNNQAEYRALEAACIFMLTKVTTGWLPSSIEIFSDSQLIVNQVNGAYKVNPPLYPFYSTASVAYQTLGSKVPLSLTWIRRELNSEADALCNLVMDKHGIVCSKTGKKRSRL